MAINLSIEQFAMSPQMIVLILRHGELESDIQRHWHRAAYEIEQENASRLASLMTIVDCDTQEFHINAGKVYQCSDGYMERFVHEEETREINHYEKSIVNAENGILANLVFYIACENHRKPVGVKTVIHTYDGWGKLLTRTSVIEELHPLRSTGSFIKDKADIIVANLCLADRDLDPCHHTYTGRYMEFCQHACLARLHCHQRKTEMDRMKRLRQKKTKN